MAGNSDDAAKELVLVVDCLEEATLEHLAQVTLPTFGCQVTLQVHYHWSPSEIRQEHLCKYIHTTLTMIKANRLYFRTIEER